MCSPHACVASSLAPIVCTLLSTISFSCKEHTQGSAVRMDLALPPEVAAQLEGFEVRAWRVQMSLWRESASAQGAHSLQTHPHVRSQDQLQALESKLQPFTGPGAAAALAKVRSCSSERVSEPPPPLATTAAAALPPLCRRCLLRLLPATNHPASALASHSIPPHTQLDPLERAQAQLAVAGAAQALLRLLLQTYGVDPSDHAQAKKDQERLLRYTRKVRKAAAEAELRESRRSLEVSA